MPQSVLHALEGLCYLGAERRILLCHAFGLLVHHRQPHRDMKPIEHVFTGRMEVNLEVSHDIPAIGQEEQLLVFLHALGFHQLPQASPRLGITGLDEGEALGGRMGLRAFTGERDDTLAGDDLEKAVLATART